MLGFSAALALWAFEFGREFAGLDGGAKAELQRLRADLDDLRAAHDQTLQVANTAESLLKAERTSQERLAQQLRQLEAEKQALQADLGFYERLLPTGGEGLQLRGLQADAQAPGQLRYQMLLVQNGKTMPDFAGRYEVQLVGQMEGRAWSQTLPGGPRPLQVRGVARVEGTVDHPPEAVIKQVLVKVMDAKGIVRASHTARL
jgi:ABC-type transporter Mla subunit MlaD